MMKDSSKSTALHLACWNRASFDVMKILIDLGGKELLVVAKDKYGDTALHDLCHRMNRNTNAAKKIKLMLHAPSCRHRNNIDG